MNSIKKVYIRSTSDGCLLNFFDSSRYRKYFRENGWAVSDKLSGADLVLLNTCAFNLHAENRAMELIEQAQKRGGLEGRIVVCGCLPKINRDRLSRIFVGRTFVAEEESVLDEWISPKIKISEIDNNTIPREEFLNFQARTVLALRIKKALQWVRLRLRIKIQPLYDMLDVLYDENMYYIKVSTGCAGNCTYCAIKNVRRELKSKKIDELIKELRDGLSRGYEKFVLIGDDLGCYGQDCGVNIVELLSEFIREEGSFKLLIYYLRPDWFLKYFAELKGLFESKKISYVNIPMQSGNDRILKLMNRSYRSGEVIEKVRELKEELPSTIVETFLLVGFPGEKDHEFEDSLRLVDEFDRTVGFEYCVRPNTLAAGMPEQLEKSMKEKRLKKLIRKNQWKELKKLIKPSLEVC